jgi:hypothetical protein
MIDKGQMLFAKRVNVFPQDPAHFRGSLCRYPKRESTSTQFFEGRGIEDK